MREKINDITINCLSSQYLSWKYNYLIINVLPAWQAGGLLMYHCGIAVVLCVNSTTCIITVC